MFKFLIILIFLTSIACSSSKFASNMAMDERFEVAMKLLEKGDYLRAKTYLTEYGSIRINGKPDTYLLIGRI